MLLDIDGLEDGWEAGVPSCWEGSLGQHESTERFRHFALQRLISPSQLPTYDASGMGAGSDRVLINDNQEDFYTHAGVTFCPGDGRVRSVRDLDFEYFRGRLVEHFDILYAKGLIVWPSRHGTPAPI